MYGLVLEGGGAKGSYHIGAYKAIKEMGIEIKGIAGTSVGALNGALITQGDYEKAYKLWENISYSQVMNADDDKILKMKSGELTLEDMKDLKKSIKGIVSAGGIDVTPLKELIEKLVDEEKMRKSDIDFGMVTVSLTDLRPLEIFIEDIPMGRVSEYLLASAYFPAFKSEKLGGKYYVDGGLYNNLPVDLLEDRGYTNIIQVRTFGMGHLKRTDTKNLNIISIEPREDLGGTLEFESERARYNLELGYYDGLKALRGLKGYKYYIESDIDLDYISDYLWNMDSNKLKLLKRTFKIDVDMDNRRSLFELIIPKISNMVNAKREDDYEVIFYLLVEKIAGYYNIDRFNIYKLKELLEIIKNEIIEEYSSKPSFMNALVQKVDFMTLFTSEEVLKEVGFILF